MARGKEEQSTIGLREATIPTLEQIIIQLDKCARQKPALLHNPDHALPGTESTRALKAVYELSQVKDLPKKLKGTYVLDLDDTLIANQMLFAQSRYLVAKALMQLSETAHDPIEILDGLQAYDLARIQEHGYTPKRWFGSVQEYGAKFLGRDLAESESILLQNAAHKAVEVGPWFAGAAETLEILKENKISIALLTKGEENKQKEKIAFHNLPHYFGDNITIVPTKSADTLREFAKDLSGPVTVIGDSYHSDIAPAEAAGLNAVHVAHELTAWEGDGEHSCHRAETFAHAMLHLAQD